MTTGKKITGIYPQNLAFPDSIVPKTSQIIVFPSWLQHEVSTHNCEHERIMISGNLNAS